MKGAAVTAATGALGPVQAKLTYLLGACQLLEGTRRDVEFIKSELEPVHSLLLRIWEREDVDTACKQWMTEARDLSYSMEEDIDRFLVGLEPGDSCRFVQKDTNMGPFEGLKNQVQCLVKRCSDEWRTLQSISSGSKPTGDPRSRFLHEDMSELVEMDEKKYQLIRLLQQHQTVCISGSAGIGKTALADVVSHAIGNRFQCVAFVSVSQRPDMTQILRSIFTEVMCSAVTKAAGDNTRGTHNAAFDATVEANIQNIHDSISKLREPTSSNAPATSNAPTDNAPVEDPETELLKEIVRFLTSTPSDGIGATDKLRKNISEFLDKKGVTDIISKFLEDKRYLLVVDDIWHWEQWEFIEKLLPNNSFGSRIIVTTRVISIAEKYHTNKDAVAYKMACLSPDAAADLSERILEESRKVNNIRCDMRSASSSIAKLSCGMPLAVICISLAMAQQLPLKDRQISDLKQLLEAEQLSLEEGQDLDQERIHAAQQLLLEEGQGLGPEWFHVAERRILEGFLDIPFMRPLAECYCIGYNELPLHLKTCLLHCTIYPPYHILEMDDLIKMWTAEGFVHEAEDAQSCVQKLNDMGFIQYCSSSPVSAARYEINAMMVYFLRCKSQEYNFVTYWDCWYDMSSGSDPSLMHSKSSGSGFKPKSHSIRRLSVQGNQNKMDISKLHVSDIRCLYVFDNTWITSLKQFKGLQMLHIHGDLLKMVDLVGICELHGLRWLSLQVALINLLPKQIGRLQHLKTLNLGNTGILVLPEETGKLEHLVTLDVSNTMITELPSEIGRLRQLETLDARNSCIRELPKEIGELEHLVTLYLCNTMVVELPREIGELQHLQTLDVSNIMVVELPGEIGRLQNLKVLDAAGTDVREICKEIGELHHLERLDISRTQVVYLPKEIGNLQNLKTLNISSTSVEDLPTEIGKLRLLETLDISSTRVKHLTKDIGELHHLKTLNISNTKVMQLPWEAGWRSNSVRVLLGHNAPPQVMELLKWDCNRRPLLVDSGDNLSVTLVGLSPFARFKVLKRDFSIPEWIKRDMSNISSLEINLWNLNEEDFKFLQNMQSLQALVLKLEVRPRDPITITSTGFKTLESFSFDCRTPRVLFQKGAMPELKYLEFVFYAFRATEDSMGIKNLRSLEKIVFRSGSPRYISDAQGIGMFCDNVRKESREHPNQITMHINDNIEVYPKKGIELFDGSDAVDGAGNRKSIEVKTSLISTDVDIDGTVFSVRSYYPFGLVE